MTKKTSYLLGILLTIFLGTFLYWKFCCNACCSKKQCKHKQEKENSNILPTEKEPTSLPFSVKDVDGSFSFTEKDNFNFTKSNFTILDSVSTLVDNGILKVKEYLGNNAEKNFNITGYYTSDETNNSAFPNLGLARANSVKNYMVSKGILAKTINTFGELNDNLVPNANNIYYGPLSYSIEKGAGTDNNDKALKKACEAIKENPLVLYFNTGEASINLSTEQRQKMADISRCVDKLGVKIQIEGHTDNIGNAQNNLALGKKRAEFVEQYLISNGILKEHINVISKGQTEPISSNKTEEGRAQNRRTIITIN